MLERFREIDGLRRKLVMFYIEPLSEALARLDRDFNYFCTEAKKAHETGDVKLAAEIGEAAVSLAFVQIPPRRHSLLLGNRLAISMGAW